MTTTGQFQQLMTCLKTRKALPQKIDLTHVGKVHIVNVYNQIDSQMIASSAMTGTDTNLKTATLKALSEYFERLAFQDGFLKDDPSCQTERSDGFAAYPTLEEGFIKESRENALSEALERFVWATWWDDETISFEIDEVSFEDKNFWKDGVSLLQKVNQLLGIQSLKVISPKFEGFPDKEVLIVVCETKNQGVLTGGASGFRDDRHKTLLRAVSELSRHALAIHRSQENGIKPESFYEKRLSYFMTNEGFKLYQKRISQRGVKPVILPSLKIDTKIEHEFSDLFYVHRCLFENQPPFIGGKLERLCL